MKQQTKFKDTETHLRRGSGGQVGKIPEGREIHTLMQIADAFKVTIDELVGRKLK